MCFARSHPQFTFPPCFKDQQHWDDYISQYEFSGMNHPEKNFCFDCLPENQRAMIEHDRCDHPDVKFFVMDKGTPEEQVVGLRPARAKHFLRWGRVIPLDVES